MPSRPHEFNLSIEIFPPKDMTAIFDLWSSIERLSSLAPEFVSVTYGAGGSTKRNSLQAASVIKNKFGLNVAGHLTCSGASRDTVLEVARAYWEAGVRRLVVLRGDAQETKGVNSFATPIELIRAIKPFYDFEVAVAAYPTKHPKALSDAADVDFLKRKFDAGATSAITQFFFEAEDFLRFRDKCAKAGIENKIIPGILPIENWAKTKSFAGRCAVKVPKELDQTFAKATDQAQHDLLSTAIATEICDTLLCEGVKDLHFYTLNRADLTLTICKALGRAPELSEIRIAS